MFRHSLPVHIHCHSYSGHMLSDHWLFGHSL